MIRDLIKWWTKNRNPHCSCKEDCGAGIEYHGQSVKFNHCETKLKAMMEPFAKFPWNQVGVDGQVLQVDEGNRTWKLLKEDEIVAEGTIE